MLKPEEIKDRFETGSVSPTDLYRLLIKEKLIDAKKYPYAYEMKLEDKDSYLTFCPFHDDQSNGDSYHITGNSKGNKGFCYTGCVAGNRPMGLLELTFVFVRNVDPASVFDFEMMQPHFWPSVQFIVKHFGDQLDISVNDVTSKPGKKERNVTEEILRASMEYYHFLATKTNYKNKVIHYIGDVRGFSNGVLPVEDLINEYKIGVTPKSDTRDKLFQALLKKKFTKEQILETGVCRVDKFGVIRDFFNTRIVIPYMYHNKVIGLYGRDLNPSGDKAYRHLRLEGQVKTPNGLDRILNEEEFLLVEGEFSKLAVVALGHSNVMEARGVNGFKAEHAEMILRARQNNSEKCKRCIMFFDPDDAGADSVKKIGHRLISAGVEVLVARLPVLYQEGNASFVDPNDLLTIYKKDAPAEFERIKSEAISLDAFLLLHELKKASPTTLSEARITMVRFTHYFESIHPMERVFLLEEVLEHMETVMNKDTLRTYLKEIWLNAEQKIPVEGFEKAIASTQPLILVTKSKEQFDIGSSFMDAIVLVRDFDEFKKKNHTKPMMLDSTFTAEEQNEISRKKLKVVRGTIEFNVQEGNFEYDLITD